MRKDMGIEEVAHFSLECFENLSDASKVGAHILKDLMNQFDFPLLIYVLTDKDIQSREALGYCMRQFKIYGRQCTVISYNEIVHVSRSRYSRYTMVDILKSLTRKKSLFIENLTRLPESKNEIPPVLPEAVDDVSPVNINDADGILTEYDLECIDKIKEDNKPKPTDWFDIADHAFSEFLQKRINMFRPTIISGTVTMADMPSVIGQNVARIIQKFEVVDMRNRQPW